MFDNIILEIVGGSRLYGTHVETSDYDYLGIFIPKYKELLLSTQQIKEKNLSIISKLPNGKNDNKAIDRKMFAYSTFMKLLCQNNPNIIEMIFVNSENIVSKTQFGQNILDNRHLFPHQGIIKRFIGYSNGQSHKMQIKTDKFNEMRVILEYLETIDNKKVVAELQYDKEFDKVLKYCKTKEVKQDQQVKRVIRQNEQFLVIGDLNIPNSVYIKDAKRRLKGRISKATNRTELISNHGYDSKFGMHLIRILLEGRDLLRDCELTYPLKEVDMLMDIRNGKYKISDIFSIRDGLLSEIKSLEKTTKLQKNIDQKAVDDFIYKELTDWIDGGY